MRGSAAFRTGVAPGGALAGPWVRNSLWTTARAVPSLDLRFADNKSLVDATTGASLVTFTRASSGTFVGSDGLIQSAVTDAPRFDHNPTTGASLGLLVEEQRTNLLLQSEAWNTSPWTSAAPYSVTVDDIVSPDGAQTADALILASGQSSFNSNVTRQVITKAASAIQYTRSVYFKALGLTTSVRFSDFSTSATNSATAIVSLIDGSIVTAPSVAGSFSGASVVVSNAGNGWWRVAFTYTTDATTSLTIRSFPYVGASQLTGDGTSGLYVWGAQLEAGAFPTSYIPTTTAAVTRSADVASISGSNFSSWYRQDEGTVFADNTSFAANNARMASFSDNTSSNRATLNRGSGSSGNVNISVTVGGVAQVTGLTFASSLAGNTPLKSAAGFKASDFAGSVNGTTPVTQATGFMPTGLSQLGIGNGEVLGANTFSGTIKRLAFWPTRLSNATLRAVTQ